MASMEAGKRQALYARIATKGEEEYTRLRLQYELLTRAMAGKLIRAPLPASPKILDSATGDGLWMAEASKQLAGATFRDIDLEAKHFEHIEDLPNNITFGTWMHH